MNNKDLVQLVLKLVGGKRNIKAINNQHAVITFSFKNQQLVNIDELNMLKGVQQATMTDHQLQITFSDVKDDYYPLLIKELDFEKDGTAPQEGIVRKVTGFIGDIIMPVIPYITIAGILKGLLIIALSMHIINPHGALYISLYAIGDSVFYFLPIFLGYTTAKRVGVAPFAGLMLGTILVYPSITGKALNFWGIISKSKYTSSFLPIILMVILMMPIYKWLKVKLPKVLQGFGPGLISLVIVVPVGLVIVGPGSNALANGFGASIQWFYNLSPVIAGIIIGALWIYVTMYGLFGIVISVVVVNIFNGSGDLTLAISIFVCLAAAGSSLAVAFKTKNQDLRDEAYPACVTAIFGVIQPALYGIFLNRNRLMVANIITGAVAGALCGFLEIRKYAMGSGIFGLPTMLNQSHPAIIPVLIVTVVSFILAFVLTLIVFKDDDSSTQANK